MSSLLISTPPRERKRLRPAASFLSPGSAVVYYYRGNPSFCPCACRATPVSVARAHFAMRPRRGLFRELFVSWRNVRHDYRKSRRDCEGGLPKGKRIRRSYLPHVSARYYFGIVSFLSHSFFVVSLVFISRSLDVIPIFDVANDTRAPTRPFASLFWELPLW